MQATRQHERHADVNFGPGEAATPAPPRPTPGALRPRTLRMRDRTQSPHRRGCRQSSCPAMRVFARVAPPRRAAAGRSVYVQKPSLGRSVSTLGTSPRKLDVGGPSTIARAAPGVRLVQNSWARSGRRVGDQLGQDPRRTRPGRMHPRVLASAGGIAPSCPWGQVARLSASVAQRRGCRTRRRGAVHQPRRLLDRSAAPLAWTPAGRLLAAATGGLGGQTRLRAVARGQVLGDRDRAVALTGRRGVARAREVAHPRPAGRWGRTSRADRAELVRGTRSIPEDLRGMTAASRSHRLFHEAASTPPPRSIPRAAVRPEYMHTGARRGTEKRSAVLTPPGVSGDAPRSPAPGWTDITF